MSNWFLKDPLLESLRKSPQFRVLEPTIRRAELIALWRRMANLVTLRAAASQSAATFAAGYFRLDRPFQGKDVIRI